MAVLLIACKEMATKNEETLDLDASSPVLLFSAPFTNGTILTEI